MLLAGQKTNAQSRGKLQKAALESFLSGHGDMLRLRLHTGIEPYGIPRWLLMRISICKVAIMAE